MLLVQNYLDMLLRWHESDNIISSSNPEYMMKEKFMIAISLV